MFSSLRHFPDCSLMINPQDPVPKSIARQWRGYQEEARDALIRYTRWTKLTFFKHIILIKMLYQLQLILLRKHQTRKEVQNTTNKAQHTKQRVQTIKDNSVFVKGLQLFNSLPRDIRNMSNCNVLSFKTSSTNIWHYSQMSQDVLVTLKLPDSRTIPFWTSILQCFNTLLFLGGVPTWPW